MPSPKKGYTYRVHEYNKAKTLDEHNTRWRKVSVARKAKMGKRKWGDASLKRRVQGSPSRRTR